MKHYDIIAVGGGGAGLTVALGAVSFGLKPLIIEKEKLGGDCLNYGCVPSKSLIHSAHVVRMISGAKKFGIDVGKVDADFTKIMKKMAGAQDFIRKHENAKHLEKKGVDVVFGSPKFINRYTVQVGKKKFMSKKFVVCTGSSAMTPPIPGLKETGFITNVELFGLKKQPASMIVLGGGPIAIEMAQTFQRLGTDVTVIQRSSLIMNKEDVEVSTQIRKYLEKDGLTIITDTAIEKVTTADGKKRVIFKHKGKKTHVDAEEILAALGRKPNIDGLGLEDIGVETSKRGIVTDKYLRSSVRHIFAAGDIAGNYQFSHIAGYEGGIVLSNMMLPIKRSVQYHAVPWATFTDPEVARVGLSEEQAKEQGLDYRVYRSEFSDVDRAITEDTLDGWLKVLVDRKGYILGAHMIGPRAGDLIHEYVLCMQNHLPISKITNTIHIYPTLAEINKKAGNKYMADKYITPSIKKFIQLFFK